MSIDFASVKSWTIPEGSVAKVTDSAGTVIWQKPAPVDKYTWEAVLASIAAGTYATDYAIGDCVPLDLGSEGVVDMQIAGFDMDDLADGSGKAHITWISKQLLKTSHRMNLDLSGSSPNYETGTGAIGGWEHSEMRTYLKDTIKPLIPEMVRDNIVEVTKTQTAYDMAGNQFTQTTTDDVWIPSNDETFDGTYKVLFSDTASRAKCVVGSTSASNWWLRSANRTNFFRYVTKNGYGDTVADRFYGVALCFCT